MMIDMQEFMSEQSQALVEQAQKFRRNPTRFTRKALVDFSAGPESAEAPGAHGDALRCEAHGGVEGHAGEPY